MAESFRHRPGWDERNARPGEHGLDKPVAGRTEPLEFGALEGRHVDVAVELALDVGDPLGQRLLVDRADDEQIDVTGSALVAAGVRATSERISDAIGEPSYRNASSTPARSARAARSRASTPRTRPRACPQVRPGRRPSSAPSSTALSGPALAHLTPIAEIPVRDLTAEDLE